MADDISLEDIQAKQDQLAKLREEEQAYVEKREDEEAQIELQRKATLLDAEIERVQRSRDRAKARATKAATREETAPIVNPATDALKAEEAATKAADAAAAKEGK